MIVFYLFMMTNFLILFNSFIFFQKNKEKHCVKNKFYMNK